MQVAVRRRITAALPVRTCRTCHVLPRRFSVLNRPPPNYPGHVPLTFVERGALAVGSAVGSLLNPRRGGASSEENEIESYIISRSLILTNLSNLQILLQPWVRPQQHPTSSTASAMQCSRIPLAGVSSETAPA